MAKRLSLFLTGFILASILVILGMIFFGKTYETRMLFAIKSQGASTGNEMDAVMDNAEIMAESLKIYDRIFENDSWASASVYQENRKEWDNLFSSKRIKKSSIFQISITGDDATENERIIQRFTPIFISEFSQFYNIKTEARIWVFEEPISLEKNIFSQNQVAFWSIFAGTILGLCSAVFLGKKKKSLMQEPFFKRGNQARYESNKKEFFSVKEGPAESEVSQEKKPIEKTIETKTNFAPANLPIAGDEIERLFGATKNGSGYKISEKSETKKKAAFEEKPVLYREATPEEVKERLNKLLGGI
ncbi:MAG: hypothetical protein ACOYS2_02665 [Patescibacteria group bacterium]